MKYVNFKHGTYILFDYVKLNSRDTRYFQYKLKVAVVF